jgi:hypothetical protein
MTRSNGPKRRPISANLSVSPVARRRGEAHAGDVDRLAPVELVDARRIDAEALEVRPDAERRDERDAGAGERAHRPATEVIEVVVRDQDGVEPRQLFDRGRDGVKPARPREANGRDPLREHRIRQDAAPVNLEQHRAVAEPSRAQARLGGTQPHLVRALDRQRGQRLALPSAEEELSEDREGRTLQPGPQPARVLEPPVRELRGRADALEAKTRASRQIVHRHRPATTTGDGLAIMSTPV